MQEVALQYWYQLTKTKNITLPSGDSENHAKVKYTSVASGGWGKRLSPLCLHLSVSSNKGTPTSQLLLRDENKNTQKRS